MSAPRRYATWLIAIVALTSLASFVLNTTVNPWRVTPYPWSSEKADPYRDISSQIRTAKAGLVRSNPDTRIAVFGSSRVANGLDPEDDRWPHDQVLNLGCSGGFIYESVAMARYAMEHLPLELAIIGIDPGDLGSDLDTRPMGDFHASPLAGADPNSELRYVIGISTAEESFQTLKRQSHDFLPQYNPVGLRVRSHKAPGKPQIAFIREQITGEAEFGLTTTGRDENELNAEKVAGLQALLHDARAKGIRMIVYFHPTHALRYLRASDAENPALLFENERRALLKMVDQANQAPNNGPAITLWDFADAHLLNSDPLPDEASMMTHWTDLDHYTVEVGSLMLARMLDWELRMDAGEDYGQRIDRESQSTWFEQVRKSSSAYVSGKGTRDIKWKEELIGQSAPAP
ncbi:MAG: hypothetical protein AAGB14_15410 [Verrucomicrobiota bacterium]